MPIKISKKPKIKYIKLLVLPINNLKPKDVQPTIMENDI